jgi:hypothetical protein
VTIGPGSYTPTVPEHPRVKVFRTGETARDIWPHLKRQAKLPDPGDYWALKPFYEVPKNKPVSTAPRTYIFG